MNEWNAAKTGAQNITMRDRKFLDVTGVENVESFDENTVTLMVGQSYLTIEGENLHINKIDVDKGDVIVEGIINGLFYADGGEKKTGVLSRFFKG